VDGMTEAQKEDAGKASKALVKIQAFDQIGRTLRHAVTWGAVAFCGYQFAHAIAAFAGQETDVRLALSAWIETKAGLTVSASLTLGVLGVGYGQWQDLLRRRNVKRMGKRIAELETAIDPHRTSSGLLPDGTTPRLKNDE